nr:hypothetical protein Iba_chr15cCG4320 [Ipomoea batatas]
MGNYLVEDALAKGIKETGAFFRIVRGLGGAVEEIESFLGADGLRILLLIPPSLDDAPATTDTAVEQQQAIENSLCRPPSYSPSASLPFAQSPLPPPLAIVIAVAGLTAPRRSLQARYGFKIRWLEGTASVVGLIAMKTYHYCNLQLRAAIASTFYQEPVSKDSFLAVRVAQPLIL